MGRYQHLERVRLSKAERLALLGIEALEEGEVSSLVRVRLAKDLFEVFRELNPKERGRVIDLGLKALGVTAASGS